MSDAKAVVELATSDLGVGAAQALGRRADPSSWDSSVDRGLAMTDDDLFDLVRQLAAHPRGAPVTSAVAAGRFAPGHLLLKPTNLQSCKRQGSILEACFAGRWAAPGQLCPHSSPTRFR